MNGRDRCSIELHPTELRYSWCTLWYSIFVCVISTRFRLIFWKNLCFWNVRPFPNVTTLQGTFSRWERPLLRRLTPRPNYAWSCLLRWSNNEELNVACCMLETDSATNLQRHDMFALKRYNQQEEQHLNFVSHFDTSWSFFFFFCFCFIWKKFAPMRFHSRNNETLRRSDKLGYSRSEIVLFDHYYYFYESQLYLSFDVRHNFFFAQYYHISEICLATVVWFFLNISLNIYS